MKSKEIEAKGRAKELIEIIKTRFVRPDGLLSRTYPPNGRTLFDNFDDLVPFFLYFGEADFLLSQVHAIYRQGESLLTLCANDGILISRTIDEWFGGLYAIWKATGDQVCFALLSRSVDFVLEHLMQGGFLSGAFSPRSGRALYYESWSAGLLETFCEMRTEFPQAFEQALTVMRGWISDEYFQGYGLFPYRMYQSPARRTFHKQILSRRLPRSFSVEPGVLPGMKGLLRYAVRRLRFENTSGWYSQLMKSNSTCAFTLLEFYRSTGDGFWLQALSKWTDSVLEAFCDKGRVFMEFYPSTGLKRSPSATPAFILADLLCDTAWWIPEHRKYLPKAKEILAYQWADRLPNGLVPFREHGEFAHIDTQVDLAISLRKYSELSGEHNYRAKSAELMEQMLSEHYSPEGYFTFSGQVHTNTIDPKYNSLVLKGIIHLITLGQPIYPGLYDLFKDR